MYDLTKDPSEKSDLAAEHPDIVTRMKAGMEAWLKSVYQSRDGQDYPEKKVIEPPPFKAR